MCFTPAFGSSFFLLSFIDRRALDVNVQLNFWTQDLAWLG